MVLIHRLQEMTFTNFDQISILAKPIFVAHQSTDASVLAAATRMTGGQAVQTVTKTQFQLASGASASNGGSSSLSGGAIAGIAIGSLCAGVLLATVITFLALRFCMGYRKSPSPKQSGSESVVELASDRQFSEMPSSARAELSSESKENIRVAEMGNYQ